MDLKRVEEMARQLISENGLVGWQFRFDSARRRMGSCSYRSKTISVSRHYARVADEEHVRDTLIHEVAHALTPGVNHGPEWRAKARALGGSGRTTAHNPYFDQLQHSAVGDVGRPLADGERLRVGDRALLLHRTEVVPVTVVKVNPTTYGIRSDSGTEWRASSNLLYVPTGDLPAPKPSVPPAPRPAGEFAVLDSVYVTRPHPRLSGVALTVIRRNAKTYTVRTPDGEQWRVSPSLLRRAA